MWLFTQSNLNIQMGWLFSPSELKHRNFNLMMLWQQLKTSKNDTQLRVQLNVQITNFMRTQLGQFKKKTSSTNLRNTNEEFLSLAPKSRTHLNNQLDSREGGVPLVELTCSPVLCIHWFFKPSLFSVSLQKNQWGAAFHNGSILASRQAAPGLILSIPKNLFGSC